MQSTFQRLRNRFTLLGIATLLLGVGMDLIYAFAPNLVNAQQSTTLFKLGIALVVVGVVLFIIGLFKKPTSVTHAYYGVIPILQKMDERIRVLAKQEAMRIIDFEKYTEVNNMINKDILKIKIPSTPETIEGLKESLIKVETSIETTLQDEITSIRAALKTLTSISSLYDSKGFGLKSQRKTDKKYLHLSSQLQGYRNLPLGSKVDELIGLHVIISEAEANLLLATIRAMQTKVKDKDNSVEFLDIAPTKGIVAIERIEEDMCERTSKIRARIGECIRELEIVKGKR